MSILLSVQNLEKAYGAQTLFRGLSFGVSSGDRVGLIGPNGAGKSTLMKILAGRETADGGEIVKNRGLRLGYLEQSPVFQADETIFSAVAAATLGDPERLSAVHEWLARLHLIEEGRTDETLVSELSGGWKKRVALARELVLEPDLLLLDEPTNHLDLESILWLEDLLASARFATLTITHDRMFLQRVANRIFDLDKRNPGGLFSIQGSYADFLDAKETMLAGEARREETLKNTVRRETEWLRRGAKARTTKQTARIERAEALKDESAEVTARNQNRSAQIDFQSSERHPQRLIEAIGVSHGYNGRALFQPIDLLITPKTRLGLLGANGTGKTTLIRVLLGLEEPSRGEVKRAERLKPAYFAQYRDELDPKKSVLKTICPDGDYVAYRDGHVFARSYLSRFLFRTEQMDMPVEKLSGGEKARLRIAQLMLQPANVLILDEPTNDLDLSTLTVLEDSLREFEGAVILVTHDRYFLDQVANQILAFVEVDGEKRLERFADTLQWEAALRARPESKKAEKKSAENAAAAPAAKKRLSFKEKRELDGMEGTILEAEGRLAELQGECLKSENISNGVKLSELSAEIATLQARIETLYARWAELSS